MKKLSYHQYGYISDILSRTVQGVNLEQGRAAARSIKILVQLQRPDADTFLISSSDAREMANTLQMAQGRCFSVRKKNELFAICEYLRQ